jgi:hypothetical protein
MISGEEDMSLGTQKLLHDTINKIGIHLPLLAYNLKTFIGKDDVKQNDYWDIYRVPRIAPQAFLFRLYRSTGIALEPSILPVSLEGLYTTTNGLILFHCMIEVWNFHNSILESYKNILTENKFNKDKSKLYFANYSDGRLVSADFHSAIIQVCEPDGIVLDTYLNLDEWFNKQFKIGREVYHDEI